MLVLAGVGVNVAQAAPTGHHGSKKPTARLGIPPYGKCDIKGTRHADVLRGRHRHKAEVICGGRGNDTLIGGIGDVLVGGRGDDRLRPHGSIVIAGRGRDRIRATNILPDLIDGGRGRDSARIDKRFDRAVRVERLRRRTSSRRVAAIGYLAPDYSRLRIAKGFYPESHPRAWTRQSLPMHLVKVHHGRPPSSNSGSSQATPSLVPHDESNQVPLNMYSQGWYRHPFVGRLRFRDPDGTPDACSATLVYTNLLITAGHCAYNAQQGVYNSAWRWYPDLYGDSGGQPNAPYGYFDARDAVAPNSWQQGGDPTHDYAFIVLNPNGNGQQASDVLGGYKGIKPNYVADTWSIGYPATGLFSTWGGEYPYYCYSPYGDYSSWNVGGSTYYTIGIGCTMTGGASGGPWFTYYDDGTGPSWDYVGGVNSRCWRDNTPGSCKLIYSYNMWSPYFTSEVISLYNYAKTL